MTDASETRKSGDETSAWEETIRTLLTRGYEEGVGRFLRAPQLGIFREHFQEIFGAFEAFHRLSGALADFNRRFAQPFQAAAEEFGRTVTSQDPSLKEPKALYDTFIAQLTDRYETFLGSKDGLDGVAEIVDAYLAFKERMDAAAAPWMKFWAIPTRQEMTDVHHRIYELKKQNRILQTALKQQAMLMETLQQRIDILEITQVDIPLKTSPGKSRNSAGPPKKPSRKASGRSRASG